MNIRTSLIAIAVSQAIAFPLLADESDIERVVINGDFKNESIQTLSASASLFTDTEINQRNATYLDEILAAAANVNFTAGASRGRFVQIRGVGLRSQFVDPINPSVGVIIDGINYSGLGGAALLFDAQQVEIYRGPQGTRFGADALAGMINITTAEPTQEQHLKIKLGVGTYNSSEAGFAFGQGLTESTAAHGSVYQSKSDGFVSNPYLGVEDSQGRDELVGRFKITQQWSDDFSSLATVHYTDINNGYDGFTLDNSRTSVADEPGQDNQLSKAIALNNVYTGLASANIAFNLTAMDSELLYSYDEDWVCNDAAQPVLCEAGLHDWGYSSTDAYYRDRTDHTAELTFSGKDQNWISGLYYQSRDVDLTRQYTWQSQDFTSAYKTENFALFGQYIHNLDEHTRLISGLRLEHYEGNYQDNNNVNDTTSDTMLGGKLAIEHDVKDRTMIYTSLSRGYKAGGVNGEALAKAQDEGLEIDPSNHYFDPEYLWNAEFGVKGTSRDNRTVLRLTAFYMYREDIQLKNWKVSGQKFAGYLDNASSGTNYGLEIDGSYQLTDRISLTGSVGYLETKINDFVTSSGLDKDGDEQAQAPKYQYAFNANYILTDHLSANIGIEGKDDYYFSDSHYSKSDSYNLVNARVAYQRDDWEVSVWARNIFDKDYAVRGFEFGNDPRDGYETHTYVQYGEPQVAGVTFNYGF